MRGWTLRPGICIVSLPSGLRLPISSTGPASVTVRCQALAVRQCASSGFKNVACALPGGVTPPGRVVLTRTEGATPIRLFLMLRECEVDADLAMYISPLA